MTSGSAAVVVAFHRPAELTRLLEDLAGAVDQIVVVNVEDDNEIARLATAAGATIVAVANIGYAAAVNAGVRATEAGVVIFMNDDLSVEPDTIKRLRAAIDNGGDVVLPGLSASDGVREPTILALPTPWTLLTEWALSPDVRPHWVPGWVHLEKWRDADLPARIQAGTAAMVAVRGSLIRAIPLPEQYFMYWEEMDWFWSLRTAGASAWYEPDAIAFHDGGRDDVRADKSALLARNAIRCVRSTQGRGAAAAAYPVVIVWWLRLWLTSLLRSRRGHAGAGLTHARRRGLSAALNAWREI